MEKKARQTSRKRKVPMPEEDEKQNESILEEVLNISGKNAEVSDEKDASPPARLKRSANKKDKPVIQPKKVKTKKLPVSPQALPPSKEEEKKSTDKKEAEPVVDEKKISTCEKGHPVPHLPGWRREVCVRKSGRTAGKMDIYFYSPDGKKLRSRPDVSAYLSANKITGVKIEEFNFSKEATKDVGKKNAVENSTGGNKKRKNEPKKKEAELMQLKRKETEAGTKDSSKPVASKKQRSSERSAAKVPPPEDSGEKNDAGVESNKMLIQILQSKTKRSRK